MRLIDDSMERGRAAITAKTTSFEVFVAGSALLILLITQWMLSAAIPGTNYFGLDGKLAQTLALTAFKFAGYFDVTNITPLQGVGSQMLTKNVWSNPSFWPFAVLDTAQATDVSALIALAGFATCLYVMMRCFDVAVLPSALAAQACILLFSPTAVVATMPTAFVITPADAIVYAPYMVALGLLARLHASSRRTFVLTTAGIFGLILYSIYCDPLWSMVVAIAWSASFAIVAFAPLQTKTIAVRLAALGCCLVLLVLCGVAGYLQTLSQYTARVQFADVLDRARVIQLVSTMSYSPPLRQFYGVCVVGWILGLVTLRGRPWLLVSTAAVSCAAWAAYGTVYLLLLNGKWIPPVPLYLEQGLFALYAAGAAAGYWGLLRAIVLLSMTGAHFLVTQIGARFEWSVAAPLRAQTMRIGTTRSAARTVLTAAAVAVMAALPLKTAYLVLEVAQAQGAPDWRDPWANEPEILNIFSEMSLAPGRLFRGTIGFTPLTPAAANTVAMLWRQGVPTANEYSQLVTPELLYFMHAFTQLELPYELNRFDLLCCRQAHAFWSMAPMLGVRYYVALRPLSEHLLPGFPLTVAPYRPTREDPGTWHVYELPRPNIGDYSPTEITVAESAADIVTMLTKADFDPTKHVVLTAPLGAPLVPARDMKLSVIRGGYHLSGRSDGTSLIVLPQQFSHCLRARAGNVRFVRANLMMAGAVFSGDIDTDIVFDYGILSPGCRRADLADLKRLDPRIDIRASHLSGGPLFPDWNEAVARIQAAWAEIR